MEYNKICTLIMYNNGKAHALIHAYVIVNITYTGKPVKVFYTPGHSETVKYSGLSSVGHMLQI